MGVSPFEIKSCALIVRMDGEPSAINLRELCDRTTRCSDDSIYHHFCEIQLRPTFDDPEFTNDFATWAYRALRDDVLAERLGILDPQTAGSIENLRTALLDVLEERLSEIDYIPWAGYGRAFYFMRASMVVFDTGVRLNRPDEIIWALKTMSRASIYYHFVEARRHFPEGNDDFSEWLRRNGPLGLRLDEEFSRMDVQFYPLRDLRQELLRRAHEVVGQVLGTGGP